MKVFIASSFAYIDAEIAKARKETIAQAADILRRRGYEVFVPHEQVLPDAWNLSNYEWAMRVAEDDKCNILSSDVVVLLTYGKERNNSGVSFECGYVAGVNLYRKQHGEKPIILALVKMNDEVESLMMWSSSDIQVRGIEALKTIDFNEKSVLKDVELS